MSENYDGLSSEELISLLKQRDIKIKEQEEEMKEAYNALYQNNEFDQIGIEEYESLDFGSIQEYSGDLMNLENSESNNKSNYNAITKEIYDARKQLFSYSVNNWIKKYNSGNAPAFYEDSVGIMARIDVDYDNRNFVETELSKLIGKVSFNDFKSYLSISTLLSTYKHLYSQKEHFENGILKDSKEKESFEQFITFIFEEKEFNHGFKLYNNYDDKLSLLNSLYPKNDFILSYQSKKEKEALEEVIKSNSELTKNNIKRL